MALVRTSVAPAFRAASIWSTEEARKVDLAAAGNIDVPQRQKSQVPNPLYEQVKLKLVEAETEVGSWRRRISAAEATSERLQKMAESVPSIEAELVNLTRDYGVIKQQYEALLARRESARISQAADASTNAVNFRIIEPPHVPILPESPNRPLLMFAVLVAGLGAGIGFSILVDKMDASFRTPESVMQAFGLPVLGSISAILPPGQRRKRVISNVAVY